MRQDSVPACEVQVAQVRDIPDGEVFRLLIFLFLPWLEQSFCAFVEHPTKFCSMVGPGECPVMLPAVDGECRRPNFLRQLLL